MPSVSSADPVAPIGKVHADVSLGNCKNSVQAFIQEPIRDVYRRQRPTALPSLTAKSHHRSQVGVDGLEVANDVPAGGLAPAHGEAFAPPCTDLHIRVTAVDTS